MANGGWFGTIEEWDRLEALLIDLDPVIDAFAQRVGLTVTKNQKEWPERSMRWVTSVNCRIQIYLADRDAMTWNIWLCCTRDEGNKRFWRQEFLVEKKPVAEFKRELFDLLESGRARLIEWSNHPESLTFLT